MIDGVEVEVPAKVNLSLEVGSPEAGRMHPLRSLVQAIEVTDRLRIDQADDDALTIIGADMEDGETNLVNMAVAAWRRGKRTDPVRIRLTKTIPVAAGLGGGSADAAATLVGLAYLADVDLDHEFLADIGAGLGADVPYFLEGGFQLMSGFGAELEPISIVADYAVTVVVPPFELSTADVYRNWDRMREPVGDVVEGQALPPSLRGVGPLRNDLWPSARRLAPDLDDWAADLRSAWGGPVLMSGSGPSLFGFFSDFAEADDARSATPAGARFTAACSTVGWGARVVGR